MHFKNTLCIFKNTYFVFKCIAVKCNTIHMWFTCVFAAGHWHPLGLLATREYSYKCNAQCTSLVVTSSYSLLFMFRSRSSRQCKERLGRTRLGRSAGNFLNSDSSVNVRAGPTITWKDWAERSWGWPPWKHCMCSYPLAVKYAGRCQIINNQLFTGC